MSTTKKINARLASLRLKALFYIAELRAPQYFRDFPDDPNGVEVTEDEWMAMVRSLKPEAEELLNAKLDELLKGNFEEVSEKDAIEEYERDHAERERKRQEEWEKKQPKPVESNLPFSQMIEWSGETEDIGNGSQQRMYFLPGKPRDYGSVMDIIFNGLSGKSYVKETKDMQNYNSGGGWNSGAKYRPEGPDIPGIKIYAPPGYLEPNIIIKHN